MSEIGLFYSTGSGRADGAPASGTRNFHAEALDLMKAEAPDLFAQVDAMLNHAEATG